MIATQDVHNADVHIWDVHTQDAHIHKMQAWHLPPEAVGEGYL